MDSGIPLVPVLPPELERIIFLHAVHNDIKNVRNYLVVAKRVRDWLMRAVFEVMILHPTCPKEFSLDELKKYGHHVQHLLLYTWNNPITAAEYLTSCPNIVDLALWIGMYTSDTIQALSHLPLKRLSIDLPQLSEPHIYILTPELITVFSNVTHLDIANAISVWAHCEALVHFRVLTHLAVFSSTEVDIFRMILDRVEGLKVVIWLSGSDLGVDREETPEGIPGEIQDDRVVGLECSYVEDWEDGARGEEDMWTIAEKIVEARWAQNP
ncbi:hypothetical protein BDN72DRAFT_961427 [Pluteus cervinus]|uniref:Uncharacterized protein n=1 Tax=Pluteus cervinus TaxID=181527 RepID=A0ACD3AN28_9AGAR|nr:hypothetical protein BDN72DRAFT_961427 [Pluteus cervinus]